MLPGLGLYSAYNLSTMRTAAQEKNLLKFRIETIIFNFKLGIDFVKEKNIDFFFNV